MAQHRRLLPDVREDATLLGPPSPPPEEAGRTSSFGTSPSAPPFSGRDIWKQFELHRRTAEYYLEQYLDQLDRISDASIAESDNLDSAQAEVDAVAGYDQGENRDMNRLKISSDTAIRDIAAMEKVIQFTLALPAPEARVLTAVAGVCTAVCTVSAIAAPPTTLAFVASVGGAFVAGTALVANPVRNMLQKQGLQDIEARLRGMREAFQQKRIGAESKNDLKREHFTALEKATKRYGT